MSEQFQLVAVLPQNPVRALAALRVREARFHGQLLAAVHAEFQRASRLSVHFSWVEDVSEFVAQEISDWWRYQLQADVLRSKLGRHRLYTQEDEAVRVIVCLLRKCARALRAVGSGEASAYILLRRF